MSPNHHQTTCSPSAEEEEETNEEGETISHIQGGGSSNLLCQNKSKMVDLHKLAQAMCSMDLTESHWTQELPRLPVPDLWLTVSRYLASLKAVLAPDWPPEVVNCELEGGRGGGGEQQQQQTADGTSQAREPREALSSEQIEINRLKYERTDELVKQFMLHEGPQLQRDLKEYANKCQNWATEFWLQDMYLSNPLPLPVNSNPFFMFPRQKFGTSKEMLMFATRIIQFSVDFKFRIDQQALKQDFGSGHGKGKPLCMETYKNFFHSYRMPHENMDRLLPQSRRSNHIVVASCNQFYILRLGQDPLDNPYRKDTSSQLNESSIFDQLLRIYRVSREHAKRDLLSSWSSNKKLSSRIPKVGLFTTENRKTWAKLHKKLSRCTTSAPEEAIEVDNASDKKESLKHDSGSSSPNTNTESLRQIEDCLFVMCLDSLVSPSPLGSQEPGSGNMTQNNQSASREPSSSDELDVEAANIILNGGGTQLFTANRWFDKFLQIIVGRNGICGINIEHSASEGITVLRFLEEFLSFIKYNPVKLKSEEVSQSSQKASQEAFKFNSAINIATTQHPDSSGFNQTGGGGDSFTSPGYIELKSPSLLLQESDKITPLSWILDEELQNAISEAESRVNYLVENFSLYILNFTCFGRTFIKNQNLSPDAFIQLGLQYSFFKLHGYLVSTYESASLRQFRLGRVDNIRANTCEAFDWIQEMLRCKRLKVDNKDDEVDYTSAERAFIKAITKQVEILRYTIIGGGPDNHLLALRQLAKIRYGDDDLPKLFTDSSYGEYLNFRLSTSQLPNESGITVGYGAVVPDGYGCSYNPCKDRIVFCVSSFVDWPQTSSSRFAKTLEESLLEMKQLCVGRRGNNNKVI